MKPVGQIRCSVYLHGDLEREDAALVERLTHARPGRRAQRFLAIVRSGLAFEQAGSANISPSLPTSDQTKPGRRMVIHLKLRQSFQPQIVAEIQAAGNRSARLRELAIRGLRAEAVTTSPPRHTRAQEQALVVRHAPDIATHAPAPVVCAHPVDDAPLDAMLDHFLSATETGG